MSFAVVTGENAQCVVMNDNRGRVSPEEWIVAKGSIAVWWAIKAYARKYNLDPRDVGYACRPLKQRKDSK